MKNVKSQTDAELRFNRKDLIEAIKNLTEISQGYDERSPSRRKLAQYLDEQHDVLGEMRRRGLDTTKLPQTRSNPGKPDKEIEALVTDIYNNIFQYLDGLDMNLDPLAMTGEQAGEVAAATAKALRRALHKVVSEG